LKRWKNLKARVSRERFESVIYAPPLGVYNPTKGEKILYFFKKQRNSKKHMPSGLYIKTTMR
jgi:hypothetical protein